MSKQIDALKLAREVLSNTRECDAVNHAIECIDKALAQPEQKQNLKLMPREATREMLEAMDECSMEGYDERLYAGHAGSVYMAAWDAFHGQLCYCGDITRLGVIHRADSFCDTHSPVPTAQPKEPEQEPVAHFGSAYVNENGVHITTVLGPVAIPQDAKLYTTPPPVPEAHKRKPLTDEEIESVNVRLAGKRDLARLFARAIEAAHGIKGD